MGIWGRLCPGVCGADWPGQLLHACLLRLGLRGFVTQLEAPELHQRRLGNLVVRSHTPQQQQPETPANAALHLSRWDNCIRTTQYTWWSFVPLNFWAQFTQPANFYFFIMAVLQTIPAVSDSDGVPTFLFPLALVMLITAAKDAYENIKRGHADVTENRRTCCICTREGGLQRVLWETLKPGDIVKLHADEPVPADLVLLNCSDPYGVAYVETMQLDGETNLKNKTCLPPVALRVMNDQDAANIKLEAHYEVPSAELYKFAGTLLLLPQRQGCGTCSSLGGDMGDDPAVFPLNSAVSPFASTYSNGGLPGLTTNASPHTSNHQQQQGKEERRARAGGSKGFSSRIEEAVGELHGEDTQALLQRQQQQQQQFAVDISQFVWRGATVRSTDWVYGLVVYTGHHTRIMKNTKQRELKYSRTQVVYNQHAVLLAIAQFALCVIAAVVYASKNQHLSDNAWYLDFQWESGLSNFLSSLGVAFGRYVLLLSYFVPITLLVQLEVCRWCQAGFLSADKSMKAAHGGGGASAQSMALLDELGSVTHVFSDKTGTLTQNLMQFRCIGIDDEVYGYEEFQEEKSFVVSESCSDILRVPSRGSSVSAVGAGDLLLKRGLKSAAAAAAADPGISPNKHVSFKAKTFFDRVAAADADHQRKARDFLMVLALCHSVLPKPGALLPEPLDIDQETPSAAQQQQQQQQQNSDERASEAEQRELKRRLLELEERQLAESQRRHSPPAAASPAAAPAAAPAPASPEGSRSLRSVALLPTGESSASGAASDEFCSSSSRGPSPASAAAAGSSPGAAAAGSSLREEQQSHADSARFAAPQQLHGLGRSSRSCSSSRARYSSSNYSSDLSRSSSSSSSAEEDGVSPFRATRAAAAAAIGCPGLHAHRTPLLQQQQQQHSSDREASAAASQYSRSPSLHMDVPTRVGGPDSVSGGTSPSGSFSLRLQEPHSCSPLAATAAAAATRETGGAREPVSGGESRQQRAFSHWEQQQQEEDQQQRQAEVCLCRYPFDPEAAYDASSPDELALTAAAKHLGAEFVCRPNLNSIQLAIRSPLASEALLSPADRGRLDELRCMQQQQQQQQHVREGSESEGDCVPVVTMDLLEVLEFDNYRKRMSVVVRDRKGALRLLVKGADSSMFAIAAANQEGALKACKEQLGEMAQRGLRTLVLGQRFLSERQFERYQMELMAAKGQIGESKQAAMAEVIARIERNIELLGCTGIDDKLQDEVVETISDLKAAGVKVWVLTGDKLETAISIGHSCSILTDRTYNAIVDNKSEEAVREQLHQYMSYIVAAQLASDAFEVVALKSLQPQASEVSEDRCVSPQQQQHQRARRCLEVPASCFRNPSALGEKASTYRHRRSEPPTIPWESFVKVLTFNATRKVVRADPKQRRNKRLSPHQVEDIVQEYLEQFEKDSEEGKAREKRMKRETPRKRTSSRVKGKKEDQQTSAADEQPASESAATVAAAAAAAAAGVAGESFPPLMHAPGGATATEDDDEVQLLSRSVTEKSTADRGPVVSSGSSRDFPAVQGYQECSITITGEALTHALSSAENRRYFFGLASLCNTVIACRVSPKQKAEVVRHCQRYQRNTVSLGIGDGANDVGMLISANVGVGIRGKEGLQAVRAADFSITEFKYLKNLLFCHGAEALRRNSFQIYQTIWKNVVFGMADFFFAFVSAWSASDLFNSWLKQLFNVLYTTLPVFLYAIFDRQLPMEVTLQTPVLYPAFAKLGVQRFAGAALFWRWFLYGLFTACCCVFVPLYGLGWSQAVTSEDGVVGLGVRYDGIAVFWSIIMVCNLIIIPYLHTWFWFIWLAVFLDFGFWFLSVGVCPLVPGDYCPELYGALKATHSISRYYFSVLLAVFVSLLPPFLSWFYVTMFRPSAQCIIRERIAKGVFDVVVAPRGGAKTVVVVPKTKSEEWRGYAFAEQDRTRLGHHRLSVIRFNTNPVSSMRLGSALPPSSSSRPLKSLLHSQSLSANIKEASSTVFPQLASSKRSLPGGK